MQLVPNYQTYSPRLPNIPILSWITEHTVPNYQAFCPILSKIIKHTFPNVNIMFHTVLNHQIYLSKWPNILCQIMKHTVPNGQPYSPILSQITKHLLKKFSVSFAVLLQNVIETPSTSEIYYVFEYLFSKWQQSSHDVEKAHPVKQKCLQKYCNYTLTFKVASVRSGKQ